MAPRAGFDFKRHVDTYIESMTLQFQECFSHCEDLVTLPGIHDPDDNVPVPDKIIQI